MVGVTPRPHHIEVAGRGMCGDVVNIRRSWRVHVVVAVDVIVSMAP
jgi:hypothetical protein